MHDRRECPECGSTTTEQVHVDWLTDEVEEVRVCKDCPTQYVLSFADILVQDVQNMEA